MSRDPNRSYTLAEALPLEIANARELLKQYEEIGPAGQFGAFFIKQAIKRAEEATQNRDTVAMLRALNELEDLR